jgi:hypothetical protein
MVIDESLALDQPLWVRLESPAKTAWIAAIPVRSDNSQEVGITFQKPCPDEFRLAVTMGLDFGGLFASEGEFPSSYGEHTRTWEVDERRE